MKLERLTTLPMLVKAYPDVPELGTTIIWANFLAEHGAIWC